MPNRQQNEVVQAKTIKSCMHLDIIAVKCKLGHIFIYLIYKSVFSIVILDFLLKKINNKIKYNYEQLKNKA